MTRSTFDEAIADAKKLREIAEQNAKNAIIDAVTPRIRDLIESHLTGEGQVEDLSGDILEDVAAEIMESPNDSEELVELTPETVKRLSDAMSESNDDLQKIEADSLQLQEAILLGDSDLDPKEIKERVAHIYFRLQECSETADSEVLDRINRRMNTLKENLELEVEEREMSGTSLRDALKEFYLAEEEEDLELEPAGEEELGDELPAEDEELEFDLEAEPDEEVEVDVDAVKAAAEDLARALGGELELGEEDELEGEEAPEEGEEVPEDEELEFGGEEEAPEEMEESFVIDDALLAEMLDGSLEEDLYEMEGMSEEEGEELTEVDDDLEESGLYKKSTEGSQARRAQDDLGESAEESDDVILEIDEGMLRQELARMRELNESRTQNSDEDQGESTGKSVELQSRLDEAYKAVKTLRRQLNEANLFNAKLLYANKLLNNKELTERQRVVVVESLDKARSLREVKLLYKSLSESVEKKNINESSRRQPLGSSSRASASGSPKQETLSESARWQQLAGIK